MSEKQKRGLLWGAVIVWMGLIFMFSAQNATESSSLSGSLVGVILQAVRSVFPDIPQVQMEQLEEWMTFFVRKAAHASVYFVLGVLVYMALGKELSGKKRFFLAVGVCFFYACTDEFHQRFVPGRSGEFRDVCIDTSGALLGTALASFISWYRRIRKKKRDMDALR